MEVMREAASGEKCTERRRATVHTTTHTQSQHYFLQLLCCILLEILQQVGMNSLRSSASRAPRNAHQPLTLVVRGSSRQVPGYRQLSNLPKTSNLHTSSIKTSEPSLTLSLTPLRSQFLPHSFYTRPVAASSRGFHHGAWLAEQKKTDPLQDKPEEEQAKASSEAEGESASGKDQAKEEEEGQKKKEEKKEDAPPPPHGSKSPWQVFTETLQSEFKASKEWNESTKALASSAHQFTENENVRRARQAYEASTSAVTGTTAKVLKTTAGAVGKGAAWTWETPVVKGVRSTANFTGTIIEKSTRPLRETEAYKNVKDVIDDGSSSRYGGWVEKEERRKAREKREAEEAAASGRPGRKVEVATEDPKYVHRKTSSRAVELIKIQCWHKRDRPQRCRVERIMA